MAVAKYIGGKLSRRRTGFAHLEIGRVGENDEVPI